MRRSAAVHPGMSGDRRAGFTLVEVLVALAVAGLCIMMMAGLIGRLTMTQAIVDEHAQVSAQGDAVFRLLRTLLQSVDVEMSDARTGALTGQAQELSVSSLGPLVLGLEAETTFRLHVIPSHDPDRMESGTLALAWRNPTDGSSFDETIATGVGSLELAYRARRGIGTWANAWSGRIADLGLVRATILFAGSHGAVPASAVLAVGTKWPQACVIDPLQEHCPRW